MKKLTNAEEEVMQILWDLGQGFVKDVIDQMPEPKPPYNTVSTVIRVLEKKEFIAHRQYGNTYEYYPNVSRDEYARCISTDFCPVISTIPFQKWRLFSPVRTTSV